MSWFLTSRCHARRVVLLVSTLAVLAVGGACASGTGAEPPTTETTSHPVTEEEHPEAVTQLTRSSEFKEAMARYEICMAEAGYVTANREVVLKDGSVLRLTEFFKATPAVVDFLNAMDRCNEESGVTALRREAGLANEPPDPGQVKAATERMAVQVGCLKSRGWQFREPKSFLGGLLVLDPIIEPGQQDAYELDRQQCAPGW